MGLPSLVKYEEEAKSAVELVDDVGTIGSKLADFKRSYSAFRGLRAAADDSESAEEVVSTIERGEFTFTSAPSAEEASKFTDLFPKMFSGLSPIEKANFNRNLELIMHITENNISTQEDLEKFASGCERLLPILKSTDSADFGKLILSFGFDDMELLLHAEPAEISRLREMAQNSDKIEDVGNFMKIYKKARPQKFLKIKKLLKGKYLGDIKSFEKLAEETRETGRIASITAFKNKESSEMVDDLVEISEKLNDIGLKNIRKAGGNLEIFKTLKGRGAILRRLTGGDDLIETLGRIEDEKQLNEIKEGLNTLASKSLGNLERIGAYGFKGFKYVGGIISANIASIIAGYFIWQKLTPASPGQKIENAKKPPAHPIQQCSPPPPPPIESLTIENLGKICAEQTLMGNDKIECNNVQSSPSSPRQDIQFPGYNSCEDCVDNFIKKPGERTNSTLGKLDYYLNVSKGSKQYNTTIDICNKYKDEVNDIEDSFLKDIIIIIFLFLSVFVLELIFMYLSYKHKIWIGLICFLFITIIQSIIIIPIQRYGKEYIMNNDTYVQNLKEIFRNTPDGAPMTTELTEKIANEMYNVDNIQVNEILEEIVSMNILYIFGMFSIFNLIIFIIIAYALKGKTIDDINTKFELTKDDSEESKKITRRNKINTKSQKYVEDKIESIKAKRIQSGEKINNMMDDAGKMMASFLESMGNKKNTGEGDTEGKTGNTGEGDKNILKGGGIKKNNIKLNKKTINKFNKWLILLLLIFSLIITYFYNNNKENLYKIDYIKQINKNNNNNNNNNKEETIKDEPNDIMLHIFGGKFIK